MRRSDKWRQVVKPLTVAAFVLSFCLGMAQAQTPAEIAAKIKAEYDRWGPIVRASGFSADSQ